MRRYYAKKRTGKSMIARAADLIVAVSAVFSFSYMLFMFSGAAIIVSIGGALLCAAVACLLIMRGRAKKTSAYIKKERERIKQELLAERLVLMGEAEYAALMAEIAANTGESCAYHAFFCHPTDKTTLTEVLLAIRGRKDRLMLISPSGFAEEAKAFIERTGRDIRLIGRSEFLEIAEKCGVFATKSEADTAAAAEMRKNCVTVGALKEKLISRDKAKLYLLCAVITAAWTFFGGFTPLYPVVGAVAAVMAFFSYREGKKQGKGDT